MKRLTTYVNGTRAGWFSQAANGKITLEYDRAWQRDDAARTELSLSMPKSKRIHEGSAPENYLWNLLPDNSAVIERWAARFGVSPGNPMGLLAHVGIDAAGAVQLVPTSHYDESALSAEGGIEPLSEAAIAKHLRELRNDPAAWVTSDYEGGYFSLAGAQAKFTLAATSTGWGMPTGRTPSTHIVKPGLVGLRLSDLNEHLTMRSADLLGLNTAKSQVHRFEDQTAIVVERFDRTRATDGAMTRHHQEDMAQAIGIHPRIKYQNEGGPGIATISAMLKSNLGRGADEQIRRFFEAAIFNWAALGTDAHAKNYALIYSNVPGVRATLAPLYDLGSALPYPQVNDRRTRLAMSFGGRYRVAEIEPRHIVREAKGVGLTAEWALERARYFVEALPDALSQATQTAELSTDESTFAVALVDRAHERSNYLQQQLDRATH